MIEYDLKDYLLEQPAISALIGDRVYPVRLPQGVTLPAVTYQRVAGGEDLTHSGAGPARALVQVDCWANGYDAALTLAAAVRAALAGHRGAMGTARYVAVRIVNAIDLPEPEPVLGRRTLEVALMYEEAA
jgi:hypothetical protein